MCICWEVIWFFSNIGVNCSCLDLIMFVIVVKNWVFVDKIKKYCICGVLKLMKRNVGINIRFFNFELVC